MKLCTCELKDLAEIASFITIVQAFGGRVLCERTVKINASGSTRHADCMKLTAEIPNESFESLDAMIRMTRGH